MKFISLSLLMMISINAFANELCAEEAEGLGGGGGSAAQIVKFVEEQGCPNKAKLKNLCMIVGSRMKDTNSTNGKFIYLYQRRFAEAACIKSSDSEEVVSNKIRNTWSTYEEEFHCTNPSFDIDQGSILKYAISKKFEDFIDEIIQWKVDLNRVDDTDKRTVLDYVQYQMDRNKGNELESTYKMYYMKLRKAGAKHRTEI